MTKEEIVEQCQRINAKPLITKSHAMFFQLKSLLMEFASNENIWSDFVGTGSTQSDYINGNSESSIHLGMTQEWLDTASYGPSCVRMSATSDYLLEPVSCTEKAKFICVKDTCPDGFVWFDQKSCVKIIDDVAAKEDISKSCRASHPSATLFMPKTKNEQITFETFLKDHFIKENVFIGGSRLSNLWIWDDGTQIFMTGK